MAGRCRSSTTKFIYVTQEGETETSTVSSLKSSHPFVVVYGDAGTGKSAFFTRILDTKFCNDKGGAWSDLNSRMLAHHICRVQHDESLDPIEWARGLAVQIFLAFSRVGKIKQPYAYHTCIYFCSLLLLWCIKRIVFLQVLQEMLF